MVFEDVVYFCEVGAGKAVFRALALGLPHDPEEKEVRAIRKVILILEVLVTFAATAAALTALLVGRRVLSERFMGHRPLRLSHYYRRSGT